MAYNESSKKATIKFLNENMEQLRVWVPKGNKDKIKAFAAEQGKSMADYVKTLISEDMKKAGHPLE